MMSRLFVILFSVLLISGNVGIDVYSHFCKHDGVSVSVFVKGKHECDSKKHQEQKKEKTCCHVEPKDDNCCTDEISIAHQVFDYSFQNQKVLPEVVWVTENNNLSYAQFETFVYEEPTIHQSNKPPPKSGRDIIIFKQVFII